MCEERGREGGSEGAFTKTSLPCCSGEPLLPPPSMQGYLTALNIEEVAQSPETRNIEADIIANLSTPTPSHSRGGISYNEALELAISHQTHPSPLLSSRHTSISTLPDHVLSRHTSLSAPPDHHHHAPLHARCSLDGVANKLSLNSQSSTGGRPQHQDHHLTSTPHHPLLLTRSSSDRVSKQASITSQTSNNNQHRPPFYQQETHSPSSLLYHPNTAESNSGLAPPSPAEAVGPNSYMSLIADSPAATPSDGNAANSTPSTDQEEVMTLVVCEPSSSSPPSSSSSSLGQQEGVAGTGPDRRDGGGGGREAPLLTSTPSAASDLPFTEVPVMVSVLFIMQWPLCLLSNLSLTRPAFEVPGRLYMCIPGTSNTGRVSERCIIIMYSLFRNFQ